MTTSYNSVMELTKEVEDALDETKSYKKHFRKERVLFWFNVLTFLCAGGYMWLMAMEFLNLTTIQSVAIYVITSLLLIWPMQAWDVSPQCADEIKRKWLIEIVGEVIVKEYMGDKSSTEHKA